MLFYLFLHQYFSIFVILNHFFIIFLLFSYLFHQFWVFTAHPSQGLYARGGGGCPTCTATLLCLYIFKFIYSSVHLSTVHIILILYLSLPIFPSFYLFVICLSTHFYFVSLDLECKISLGVLSGWGRGGTIPTQVSSGGQGGESRWKFQKQRKNKMKTAEKILFDYLTSALLSFYSLKRNRINFQ